MCSDRRPSRSIRGVGVTEVHRLSNQRISLEAATNVAHVCANPNIGVRPPVDRDHADFVDPLVADRDITRGLDDFVGATLS